MSEPIPIREIVVRECREKAAHRGQYTTGEFDPEESVWLFVTVSDGELAGHGECVPTSLYYEPGHIGRSDIDEWAATLELAESLIGRDARALSRLTPEDPESDDANSLKDTIDFALHDLVGRRLGAPVATLLGGIARPSVWAIPVIHLDTPEAMAEKCAGRYRRHGIRYFKLKPSGEPETDERILRLIREKTGPEVRFTLDANYALKVTDLDEAARYMDRLAELGLEVYEDPLPFDIDAYHYLNERTRVRIMVDEYARTPQAVLRIIEKRAADQINIHANWAGGFQPALRKAALAALGGLPCMIGSTDYLGPGSAAYLTLCSCLPLAGQCEQGFVDYTAGPSVVKAPYALRDGQYLIPDKPGLGVDVDLDAVEALTVRKETIA